MFVAASPLQQPSSRLSCCLIASNYWEMGHQRLQGEETEPSSSKQEQKWSVEPSWCACARVLPL